MVEICGVFSELIPQRIVLLGDFMVDKYTIGNVHRISPEAPVSIMNVKDEIILPGGAGNVVLNLLSLECSVVPFGRIGNDAMGQQLIKILREKGVDTRGLFIQDDYPTIVKNRIIAQDQQVIRLDYEKSVPLPIELEDSVLAAFAKSLPSCSLVAISDYGKGFLSDRLISECIRMAQARKIGVIVDPKGVDFKKYKGCSLIKPNYAEALGAAKLNPEAPLEKIAQSILKTTEAKHVLITRSSQGMSLFNADLSRHDFPVPPRKIRDVTGAGDTVLATLCLGIGSGISLSQCIELSNLAAGIAIEELGCAQVTLPDLAHRLLQTDPRYKIFDDKNLEILHLLTKNEKIILLDLPKNQEFNQALFEAIRKLATEEDTKLMVSLHCENSADSLVNLMASLAEIDFVVLVSDKATEALNKYVHFHSTFSLN